MELPPAQARTGDGARDASWSGRLLGAIAESEVSVGTADSVGPKGRPCAEDDGGHSPDYAMHFVLRQIALADPVRFLAVLASPNAGNFLDLVIGDVSGECGRPPSFGSDAVKIHRLRVKDYPCAMLEFPEPREMGGPHFIALVALIDASIAKAAATENVPARFFTLEKGFRLDGSPRTVLGEWTMDSHCNYGDGPAVSVPAFAGVITKLL